MNSVERMLTALRGGTPDKVPFAFGYIHPRIREGILDETILDAHHYKVCLLYTSQSKRDLC